MKNHAMNAEAPAPRTIRIGKANVGLVGLDMALHRLLPRTDLAEGLAVDLLYDEIKQQNYVPDSAAELYKQALRQELRRRLGKATPAEKNLTIRVLGSSCVSCNRLSGLLIDALQKHGLAADMESVHDLDEIWRFGVTKVPALIINGSVKCAGRLPTPTEIEEWLLAEAETR